MLTSLSLSLLACLSVCPPGEEPGTIVVVGGDLRPITFSLPTGIEYQLSYDDARVALWFDLARTQPAPPLLTFQAPAQIVHGDLTGDARINGADVQTFVDVVLGNNTDPALIAQADFDESGTADLADTPLFVSALLAAGPFQNTVIILYAEGLTAGTDLCDAPVDLLTDQQGTGTFALAATAQITVVSLTLSPSLGPIGTPLTLTVAPAVAPLVFDAVTTASWAGVYAPDIGPPSAVFTVSFDANQVREQTTATGVIVLGDGSPSVIPGPSGLVEPGSFDGDFTVDFQGTLVTKPVSIVATEPPFFARINYTDTSIMSGPPELGDEITETPVLLVNPDTMTPPSLEAVIAAGWAHLAPVLLVQENSITTPDAPATVLLKVVTFDANDVVVDQTAALTLTKVSDPDGDPDHIIYAGDLNTPIVLLDVMVDPLDFPGFEVVFMPSNAETVRVVPAN